MMRGFAPASAAACLGAMAALATAAHRHRFRCRCGGRDARCTAPPARRRRRTDRCRNAAGSGCAPSWPKEPHPVPRQPLPSAAPSGAPSRPSRSWEMSMVDELPSAMEAHRLPLVHHQPSRHHRSSDDPAVWLAVSSISRRPIRPGGLSPFFSAASPRVGLRRLVSLTPHDFALAARRRRTLGAAAGDNGRSCASSSWRPRPRTCRRGASVATPPLRASLILPTTN
jgi:hypothetical protein